MFLNRAHRSCFACQRKWHNNIFNHGSSLGCVIITIPFAMSFLDVIILALLLVVVAILHVFVNFLKGASQVAIYYNMRGLPSVPLWVSLALPLCVLSCAVPQLVFRHRHRISTGTHSHYYGQGTPLLNIHVNCQQNPLTGSTHVLGPATEDSFSIMCIILPTNWKYLFAVTLSII